MKTKMPPSSPPQGKTSPGQLVALLNGADRVTRVLCTIGIGISAAALVMCLFAMTYAVLMRYIFVAPQAWSDEIVGYFLVATVMCGIAYALRHNEHIAVDILTERLGPTGQKITEVLGLTAIVAVAGMLMVEAYETFAFSKMIGLRSNGSMATHMFIPQAMMPVGFGLLLVTALVGLLRSLCGLSAFSEADEAPVAGIGGIEFNKKVGIE